MQNRRLEITYYRAKLDKHNSYIRIHDFLTHTDEFYNPKKILGNGSYGEVRLFAGDQGNQVAVKAHLERVQVFTSITDRNKAAQEIEQEFFLLKKASAHPELLDLTLKKNNKIIKDAHGKEVGRVYLLNYRLVEPFIPGMEFRPFATSQVQHSEEMAKLFLQAAQEVHRVHRLGVIHGDVSSRNMLANDQGVNLIDFGLAYFKKQYPVITRFIDEGEQQDPALRPFLAVFIEELSQALDWKNKLPAQLQAVVIALEAADSQQLRKLLDSDPVYSMKNLSELVKVLIKHQDYNSAVQLLKIKKRMTVASLGKSVSESVTRKNALGESLLHAAARAGLSELTVELLKSGADISQKNKAGETALDVSGSVCKPVLALFAYTASQKSMPAEETRYAYFFKRKNQPNGKIIAAASMLERIVLSGHADDIAPAELTEHLATMQETPGLNTIYQHLILSKWIRAIKVPDPVNSASVYSYLLG